MLIKSALILSVILQFGAAIIALSLIRRTRTNIAWWLISGGFLLMAIRRLIEIFQVYNSQIKFITEILSSWTGVLISVFMLLSLIFIKRIFNIQEQIEDLRRKNEIRVLSAILKTEERERQHFAKELHDGLGPLLSSVKMAVSSISRQDEPNMKVISNAENLIDESIVTLKEISNRLSPHILTDFGLYRAVKSFINKLKVSGKPVVHLNSNLGDRRFPFNIEVVLYRVICELVSNTLSHASAGQITISLNAGEDYISLEYKDDGIGFDMAQISDGLKGQGYANVQSRIKALGGSFSFFTEPGKGVEFYSKIKTD